MPQVEITIGGRSFDVACQEGEEQFLQTAAAMLDTEASSLSAQVGRMPESRMLLMAGLLLADRTAGLEERVRQAEGRIEEVQGQLAQAEASAGPVASEQAGLSPEDQARLLSVLQQAEGLADQLDA